MLSIQYRTTFTTQFLKLVRTFNHFYYGTTLTKFNIVLEGALYSSTWRFQRCIERINNPVFLCPLISKNGVKDIDLHDADETDKKIRNSLQLSCGTTTSERRRYVCAKRPCNGPIRWCARTSLPVSASRNARRGGAICVQGAFKSENKGFIASLKQGMHNYMLPTYCLSLRCFSPQKGAKQIEAS